jgi:hypothetical protein
MDKSKQNSPVAGPVDEEATVMLNTAADTCYWNGQSFKEGDLVDSQGQVFECSLGNWVKHNDL